jgi:hypothetical protein
MNKHVARCAICRSESVAVHVAVADKPEGLWFCRTHADRCEPRIGYDVVAGELRPATADEISLERGWPDLILGHFTVLTDDGRAFVLHCRHCRYLLQVDAPPSDYEILALGLHAGQHRARAGTA